MIVKNVPLRSAQLSYYHKVPVIFNNLKGKYEFAQNGLYTLTNPTLRPNSVYFLDSVDINVGLAEEVFYKAMKDAFYQLYKNEEPQFNKPNTISLGNSLKNNEIRTTESTQVLKVQFTGFFDQIAELVGYSGFDIFVNFHFIVTTNSQYDEMYAGLQNG